MNFIHSLLNPIWNFFNDNSFLLAVLAAVIAAYISIFVILFFLRPKIKISKKICKQKDRFDSTKDCFVFKVVNKSWFHAFDLSVKLIQCDAVIAMTSQNRNDLRITTIELEHPTTFTHVAKNTPWFWKKITSRDNGYYAIQFKTYEKITKALDDEHSTLRLQVIMRHGLSGLTHVFHRDYRNTQSLFSGYFGFGNDCSITPPAAQ